VTVRTTCFRREEQTAPLARHTAFSMREIVCVGDQKEVQRFLERLRRTVEGFFHRWSMPVKLERATDPFFNAPTNRKYIMQKVAPLKHEMVFDESLAIGSINFHQDSFGSTYGISYQGEPVFSGCVAFGIERWVYAFLHHFGTESDKWPGLEELSAA